MKCEKCGKELVEGTPFCVCCGARVAEKKIVADVKEIPIEIKNAIDDYKTLINLFCDNADIVNDVQNLILVNKHDDLCDHFKNTSILILSYYICGIIIRNKRYSNIESNIHCYLDDEYGLREQCDEYLGDEWYRNELLKNEFGMGLTLNSFFYILCACDVVHPELLMHKMIDDIDTILKNVLICSGVPTDSAEEFYRKVISDLKSSYDTVFAELKEKYSNINSSSKNSASEHFDTEEISDSISEDKERISFKIEPAVYQLPGIIDDYNCNIEIDHVVKTKGKLFLSQDSFYFKDDNEKIVFKASIDKFYQWKFESENMPNGTINCRIKLLSNGFPYRFKKTIHYINLGNLTEQQERCAVFVCGKINRENADIYAKKLLEEERIIKAIIADHYNELENFIFNQTNDILLLYNPLHILYNHFETNYFHRNKDDLLWGRKPLGDEYPKNDFNLADELLNQFDLLMNYLSSSIDRLNKEDADISYYYIVWQSMISVAIDYYSKEFSEKHNGKYSSIDEVAREISKEGTCTNFDFMRAVYYLLKENLSSQSFFDVYGELSKAYDEEQRNNLQNAFNQSLLGKRTQANITIDDIDMMSGVEFESFLKDYFEKRGYLATTTKASGDQGIDVIIEKNAVKTGVQAKCYSGTVGNSAIQEAVAGKKFYNCDKVMVITNNFFTDSAIALAKANDVVLWDRNILKEKL